MKNNDKELNWGILLVGSTRKQRGYKLWKEKKQKMVLYNIKQINTRKIISNWRMT